MKPKLTHESNKKDYSLMLKKSFREVKNSRAGQMQDTFNLTIN